MIKETHTSNLDYALCILGGLSLQSGVVALALLVIALALLGFSQGSLDTGLHSPKLHLHNSNLLGYILPRAGSILSPGYTLIVSKATPGMK